MFEGIVKEFFSDSLRKSLESGQNLLVSRFWNYFWKLWDKENQNYEGSTGALVTLSSAQDFWHRRGWEEYHIAVTLTHCEENCWPAFWRRITTYPCFCIKLDLYVLLGAFFGSLRVFAVVASTILHTWGEEICSIPTGCLTLPRKSASWWVASPGGINKRMGLQMLNFEGREAFKAGMSSTGNFPGYCTVKGNYKFCTHHQLQ